MPEKHIKNERAKYERRMENALDKLALLDPETVAEFRAARAAVLELNTPAEERYARIRSTKDAIRACLEHEQQWLAKKVIADLLHRGGFPMDPQRGRYLVVANIDKNVQRGHFVVNEDGNVGLPEWDKAY